MRAFVAALLAVLTMVPAAGGSIGVGNDAKRPRLAVGARGFAQITWTEGGVKQSVIIPPKGQLTHGGSLSGPDVSRPAAGVRIPLALAVRQGPGGILYALQQWQVTPGGPVELHFARWTGAAPELSLAVEGQRLTGTAAFQDRPLTGLTSTLEGKRVRVYVQLDCLGCPGTPSAWTRMIGVAPKADGSFAAFLRPAWLGRRYRATVNGPNVGTTYAPDAQVAIAAA